MKLNNKFAYLYSKSLGNHALKIMKKYLEIYFKKLEKSWKNHGILSVRKKWEPCTTLMANCKEENLYRPQGKVMFSEAYVILFTGVSLLLREEWVPPITDI